MAQRDDNRRYSRCEACGDLAWCRRLSTGVWECEGCIEHSLVEFTERDRTERRIRAQMEKEMRMDIRPLTMAERIAAVARRRGYTEADLADVCKHHEVQMLARAEARDEQRRERDAIEADVAAVGRELGLDPATKYRDRCLVFDELARRGHRIAAERYGRPA